MFDFGRQGIRDLFACTNSPHPAWLLEKDKSPRSSIKVRLRIKVAFVKSLEFSMALFVMMLFVILQRTITAGCCSLLKEQVSITLVRKRKFDLITINVGSMWANWCHRSSRSSIMSSQVRVGSPPESQ